MFYKLNNFIFIRKVNNYLKIWNKLTNDTIIGDLSSYLFLKHLSYEPQSLEELTEEISKEFTPDTDIQLIKNDVEELLESLIPANIITSGITPKECIEKKVYAKEEQNNVHSIKCDSITENINNFGQDYVDNPVIQGLIIEITQECNERCVHCYIPHESKNILMADDDFYKIIDECVELGTVVDIKVSGGECMTHPSFKKFISYVKDKGFALTVMTNLTLLDDEIISILKKGTFSKVQVSLFSLNPQIHDSITTIKGSFDKTLKNLQRLYDAGISVTIATQIMEVNKNEIEDLYKFTQKYNFDFNLDWTIMAQQNGNKQNLVQRVKDISFYKEICNIREKYEEDFKKVYFEAIDSPLRDINSSLCSAGMNLLHIGTDLNVHPCAGWMLNIGNLASSSLKEIWTTSEKLKKIRTIKLKNYKKCSSCPTRNICTICMAQCFSESKTMFEVPKYSCDMFKIIESSLLSSK